MKPGVAIIIASYNVRDDLARCLESLTTVPPETPHEIVVVDNGSSDGTVTMLRTEWPAVRVIPLDRNVGFAAANNVGIRETRAAGARLLLLLNSDTVAPPGSIDRLVDRLVATPEAAVAGPRLVDGAGLAELSFGRMVSPLAEMRQKIVVRFHHGGLVRMRRAVERRTRREQFVDWVSGACLLVWRADAEAVGLLDERYFIYLEDVDFCAAIRARGRRVLFTPAAEIMHLRGRARVRAPALIEAAYRQAQLAFYEKHHPAWAPVLRLYLRMRRKL